MEQEFVKAWKELSDIFMKLPLPPSGKGILVQSVADNTPASDGQRVFALDPKCILHALDATTGKELWRKDFVGDYRAQIPPWYNGQNPLLDGDRLVLGVGGEALMVALDPASGKEIWRTPNPNRDVVAPLVALSASDLLVNARGEPGLAHALAHEIPSADSIDRPTYEYSWTSKKNDFCKESG